MCLWTEPLLPSTHLELTASGIMRLPDFRLVYGLSIASPLHYPAYVVQATDDRRMQAIYLDQVPHRIAAPDREPMTLAFLAPISFKAKPKSN